MKIREVRIWEKDRVTRYGNEVRNVPREFKWSKTLSIKVDATDFGWLRVFLSETNGAITTISIPQAQIESIEVCEVPDAVEPSE